MKFNNLLLFISCLFSFSALVLTFLSYLRIKKHFIFHTIFVSISFFMISANSYFATLYEPIKNQWILLVFGTFLSLCFTYGILNFSLDLIQVSKKAPVRFWADIYSIALLPIFLIINFTFPTEINFLMNIFGIWIPAILAVMFCIILFKKFNKGLFVKEKKIILLFALSNVVLGIISKQIPFIFINFASIITIVISYEYFYSNPIKNQNDEISESFIKSFNITKREQEILTELLKGKTNKELAECFFVTQKTIEAHLGNIYKKTGVKNRLELFSRIKQ